MKPRSKGGRPPTAVTQERKKKTIELLKQGRTQQDIARELGIHPVNVCRSLKELRETMTAATQADWEVYRRGQLSILEMIETSLLEGQIAPEIAREWRTVRADIARLLGLNAPERSLAVRVQAQGEALVGYRKFLHETRWVPEADFEKIWVVCRQLSRPPQADDSLALLPPDEEWDDE